jgi:DNA methylase
MKLMAEDGWCRLYCGDSSQYEGEADLVLTNAYAPIPSHLRSGPMIVSHSAARKARVEELVGQTLTEIGRWHRGTQAVWVANLEPRPLDLEFLAAEECEPGRGWWPLDLPLRLLNHYYMDNIPQADPHPYHGMVVWDGFMGRGTAGMACRLLNQRFVGIDIDVGRVELAKRYLGVA